MDLRQKAGSNDGITILTFSLLCKRGININLSGIQFPFTEVALVNDRHFRRKEIIGPEEKTKHQKKESTLTLSEQDRAKKSFVLVFFIFTRNERVW